MTRKNQAGLIKIIDALGCMEKCLSCAICLEISSDPVETRCGHLFCRTCIQKVLSHPNESCPICKFSLTRRSVLTSGQMGLSIKQLSKLVDAISEDTSVDMTSCLKTNYKKTFLLPSAFLSSPQLQQDKRNLECSTKSDAAQRNVQKNTEESIIPKVGDNLSSREAMDKYSSFHQPREQAKNKVSTKTKLREITSKSVGKNGTIATRIQNENVFPPDSICNPEKIHDKRSDMADRSLDENRQCLRDISAINENLNLSNQSIKTWSRVAKFGKELRRRSGSNSPRPRKKTKLSVNVRDKSTFANSLTDNSTDQDKSEQDRVDDGLNTAASMRFANEDEGDRLISVDKTPQTVEEKEKPSNTSDADVGKERTAETARVAAARINDVLNVGKRKVVRTKQTQYADRTQPENVVRFKKFGHLFKTQRKCVAFLYLGTTKPPRSDYNNIGPAGICNLCSSSRRSGEILFAEKRSVRSRVQLNRAKSFESSSLNLRNSSDNPKLLPLDKLCVNQTRRDSRTSIDESGREDSSKDVPSEPRETIISVARNPEILSSAADKSLFASVKEADKSLLGLQKASPESPTNRKRKRSDPDHGDQPSMKQTETRVLLGTSFEEDCAEKTLPEEKGPSEPSTTKRKRLGPDCTVEYSNKHISKRFSHDKACTENSETGGSKVHEVGTTHVNDVSENTENVVVGRVEIDSRTKSGMPDNNNSSRINVSKKSLPLPRDVSDVSKAVNSPGRRYPVGLEAADAFSRPQSLGVENAPEFHQRDAVTETYASENSLMNITGEEMLLKKFEENLFGRKTTEDKRGDERNEKRDKDNEVSFVGCGEKNDNFQQCNESDENEDFMELTPTNQSLIHTNDLPEMRHHGESPKSQRNAIILGNSAQKKCAETPIRSRVEVIEENGGHVETPAQANTRIRPLYQSTPKSSQLPTDQCPSIVYRQKEPDAPRIRRGCILCSGLTTKQCEDVKNLASLFNMQYTKKFSSDVTHVIVKTNEENNGACKTLKYLQGVAYRKWVLNFNWIVDCALQRKLLNEEAYEVVDSTTLIAGPKKARIGENGRPPFDNFVFLCVEPFQNISVSDYEDLLRQMGATVVGSLAELAAEESVLKIIAVQAECHEKKIIEWHQITRAVPVAQEWIVECISQYRLVSLLPFLQELVPQDVLDLGFPDELIQDDDSDFVYDASA